MSDEGPKLKIHADTTPLEEGLKVAKASLKGLKNLVSELGIGEKLKEQAEKAKKSMSGLAGSIKSAGKELGIMNDIVGSTKQYFSNALKSNEEFSKSLNGIKVNLITAFKPVYDIILPAIKSLMSTLQTVSGYGAVFSATLFGTTYDEAKNAAKGLDLAGNAASGLDFDSVGSPGNISEAVTLFEKFNDLLGPAKEGFSALTTEFNRMAGFAWEGLLGFYEGFLQPLGTWVVGEGLTGFINILTQGLAAINWEAINTSLFDFWTMLAPFAINVGEGLLWFFENVLVPLGAWTMSEVIPAFLGILSGALQAINAVIAAVAPSFTYLFENFLKPIAVWTGGKIIEILEGIGQTFVKISEWFTEHSGAINEVLQGIGTVLAIAWENLLKPTLESLWDSFKRIFGGLAELVGPVIGLIVEVLGGLVTFLSGAFTGDWQKAWDGIKGIFLGIWDGISGAIRGPINTIMGGVERLINGVINALNVFIGGINKVIAKLNEMAELIGKRIPSIPTIGNVSLPRLAKGGLVHGEIQAIVGDNFNSRQDPEVVSPLSKLQDMITGAILQRDVAAGDGEITIKMVLESGEPLAELLIDPFNKTAKNLGYAPVFRAASV